MQSGLTANVADGVMMGPMSHSLLAFKSAVVTESKMFQGARSQVEKRVITWTGTFLGP